MKYYRMTLYDEDKNEQTIDSLTETRVIHAIDEEDANKQAEFIFDREPQRYYGIEEIINEKDIVRYLNNVVPDEEFVDAVLNQGGGVTFYYEHFDIDIYNLKMYIELTEALLFDNYSVHKVDSILEDWDDIYIKDVKWGSLTKNY